MPKRTDIHKILIIGAGPIIIGQACEFDYSGTQACKALREEGFEVMLVNSNPATIMTDPEMANRTYIEPITPEVVEQAFVLAKELEAAADSAPEGQVIDRCESFLLGTGRDFLRRVLESTLQTRAESAEKKVALPDLVRVGRRDGTRAARPKR